MLNPSATSLLKGQRKSSKDRGTAVKVGNNEDALDDEEGKQGAGRGMEQEQEWKDPQAGTRPI